MKWKRIFHFETQPHPLHSVFFPTTRKGAKVCKEGCPALYTNGKARFSLYSAAAKKKGLENDYKAPSAIIANGILVLEVKQLNKQSYLPFSWPFMV